MKRHLWILLVAFLCLPNISCAQKRHNEKDDLRALQVAIATIWYSEIYNGIYDVRWGKAETPGSWEFVREKRVSKTAPIEEAMDPETSLIISRWKDGSIYRGQPFYENLPSAGVMFYADGSCYSGMWQHFLPHGKGTYIAPNGVKFSVKSIKGVPHGKGVIQDSDGTMYQARWKHAIIKIRSIKRLKK